MPISPFARHSRKRSQRLVQSAPSFFMTHHEPGLWTYRRVEGQEMGRTCLTPLSDLSLVRRSGQGRCPGLQELPWMKLMALKISSCISAFHMPRQNRLRRCVRGAYIRGSVRRGVRCGQPWRSAPASGRRKWTVAGNLQNPPAPEEVPVTRREFSRGRVTGRDAERIRSCRLIALPC